jgi:hypothetical protein
MAEGKPPSGKGAEGGKKSGGSVWGFLDKVLKNVSFEAHIGVPGSATRPPTGNPTDPASRMEPVRQDRKETYDEMIYRTTDGAQGQAPAVRVDRERQHVARSLDSRTKHDGRSASIPKDGGEPLSKDVRTRMEPQLGGDLSDVRVHRSASSAEAARGLNAKAFTVGPDVHFGAGTYEPGTKEGDRLIGHELTHVVQGQRSGVQRKPNDGEDQAAGSSAGGAGHEVSSPGDPAEKEADAKGDEIADKLHGKDAAAHPAAGGTGGQKPGHEGKGSHAEGSEHRAAPEAKPAPISAKFVGVGTKLYRAPLLGADGKTPLGQSSTRPRNSRAPEGPNMAPVIGKLTQAITMFTTWAQRPADPANTIAQQILRELEGCREQAQALQEAQPKGTPPNQLDAMQKALAAKIAGIHTLDPQYALISIAGMSVTVTHAKRQMAALTLPPWTMLDPAMRPEYVRQLREQQDGVNAMVADQWRTNRERYVVAGRSAQGTSMQRRYQNRMGRPPNTAAPHNPDQGPGGFADPTGAPAHSAVNSHVGSQWPTRIPLIDTAVTATDPASRLVTQMNVQMTVA